MPLRKVTKASEPKPEPAAEADPATHEPEQAAETGEAEPTKEVKADPPVDKRLQNLAKARAALMERAGEKRSLQARKKALEDRERKLASMALEAREKALEKKEAELLARLEQLEIPDEAPAVKRTPAGPERERVKLRVNDAASRMVREQFADDSVSEFASYF